MLSRSFAFALSVALTGIVSTGPVAWGQATATNFGSLGAAGNGTHTANTTTGADVTLNVPGPLAAPGDVAVGYAGGARTLVPYLAALNPTASSPFTIEFWARPTVSDNDDSPITNRYATGDRSGWVFFQRDAGTGWNFRMYNGAGSALGWDLTGGTATLDAWSHVAATWNGSAAQLYVNGLLVDATNAAGLNGIYNPNPTSIAASAPFGIGALFDGASASTASIDEVAYYAAALSPAQIAGHFVAASLPTAGAYRTTILTDNPLLYFPNSTPSTPKSGDINDDGVVNREDAALLAQYFGTASGSEWATGDLNGDGATNLLDMAILQSHLESGLAGSAAAAVPEPSSVLMAIVALGVVGFTVPRRRK